MADFGSIAILVKLVGGADVLKQLGEIRKVGKELEKPINIQVAQDKVVVNAEKIAQATAKTALAQQKVATEMARTEAAQARAARAAEQTKKSAESDDLRRERRVIEESNKWWANQTKLAQQAQALREKEAKAYEQGVTKQAEGFQRAIRQVELLQHAKQKAAEKDALRYQQDVEKQASGFQRAIRQVDQDQQTQARARAVATAAMIGNISTGLNRVSGLWDRSMQGLARFSDGLTHAGQVAATFAYRLTLITAPIDLLIAKSTQFSIELEYSLAKVATQLDGTLDSIRQYAAESKGLTIGLQSQYGVDAREISSALYYQVSSGVDPDVAKAALAPLTRLAAAAQTSPDIASQALTASLNVFREELSAIPDLADRASYALEVLWAATKKGRFEFSDFATQFGRSAGQAEAAGMTLSQTAAMLASLSQVFTPSQSSTSLNSFMKAFIDQTPEAAAAFKELRVQIYETIDGVEQRRDAWTVFLETMGALGGKYAVSAREGDRLTSSVFGDIRGGRAAQYFSDPEIVKKLLEDEKAIANATGGIARDWELMSEQIKTVINQTIGMFYEFGESVTEYLEPTIRGAFAGIQALFQGLIDNKQVAQIVAQVGAGLAVAAPAALVFATALMGAGGLITAIATLMSPAYLIGFAMLIQGLAPSLTAAASASSAFGGGLNGILATIVETARQLGLLSDKDAFSIFEKLGVKVDTAAFNNVKDFVAELRKLGDDAAKIGNGIKTIAEGVGQLIDNISKGKGLLGFFAGVVRNVAGLGEGTISLAGSGGIATALDAVIGGMVVAKLGGILAGALKFVTTQVMHVNAGTVSVAGLNPLGQTPFIGADGKPVAGGAAGGILGAGAGGLLIASIGAAISQKFFDDIKGNSLATSVFRGGDFGNPFTSVIAGLVNEAAKAITGQGFVEKIFGQAVKTTPESTSSSSSIMTKNQQVEMARLFGNSSQLPAASIVSSFNGAINAVRTFASAAVSAASKIASIAGMTVGMGYFAPPTVSADPNARYRALDARYQAMYPGQMAAAEQVFTDKMQVADTRRAAAQRAEDALKQFADAAEDAAKRLADAVRGLVSEALGATSVTEKDQERMDLEKELSKLNARLANDNLGRQQQRVVESRIGEISVRLEQLGAYKDQPDEFARRTRAVATGTDPSTYGQAYQEQLALAQSKMPGASLEDIAAAFGDKSLFAKMTPDEIDQMWNWDAVVDSVRRGIDRIVGEWKLMKQAVGEVMSQLTNDEIASLKEALGLGADTSLDSLASKFLGKTTGLGAEGQAIGGTIDEETMGTFGGFADILERIKDNADIVVKMSFDEKMWEKAKEAIDAAEEYIREHLAKYADIFIQITARFSEESGGGSGNTGGADGGKPPPEGKATGGYVTQGIYKVGEQGYEYVLPHPLTKWIETMMGGRINSPNDIMWLIQALTSPGGKAEALAKSADWAATQFGGYYEMPKNFANWINRIKVIIDDQKMSLDDALWQMGNPSVTTARPGGGGGAGGTGSGGSGDLSSLKASLDTLVAALNRLTRAIDAMSRAGFQTPQPVSDFVGAAGTRGGGGGSNSETIIFNGDIVAPNQATVKTLYDSIMNQTRRNTSARANHGMA